MKRLRKSRQIVCRNKARRPVESRSRNRSVRMIALSASLTAVTGLLVAAGTTHAVETNLAGYFTFTYAPDAGLLASNNPLAPLAEKHLELGINQNEPTTTRKSLDTVEISPHGQMTIVESSALPRLLVSETDRMTSGVEAIREVGAIQHMVALNDAAQRGLSGSDAGQETTADVASVFLIAAAGDGGATPARFSGIFKVLALLAAVGIVGLLGGVGAVSSWNQRPRRNQRIGRMPSTVAVRIVR